MKINELIPSPIFADVDRIKHPNLQHVTSRLAPKNQPNFLVTNFQKACEFLYSYRGSPATFNTYRREIERLCHWSWFVVKKSLFELDRNDIESFIEFCQKPPVNWIGMSHVARFQKSTEELVPNSAWRPFVTKLTKKEFRDGKNLNIKNFKLSQSAIQSIFSVLSSFYNYLVLDDVTNSNPVMQIRQKSKFLRSTQQKTVIRRLSELQWSYVIETADILAKQNPEIHERTLFIMNALFSMYLRISELAASSRWTPEMGHFYRDQDNNWWFKTVGKGNKERIISVSDAMLAALKRYRTHLGLSALPTPGEITPLIISNTSTAAITSTRGIRKIVQKCFDETIERLRSDQFHEEADALMSATVHWLRHTGISEDVKTRPREHVRDDAGHSSSAITDRYIDIELRERALSAKNKKIIPE